MDFRRLLLLSLLLCPVALVTWSLPGFSEAEKDQVKFYRKGMSSGMQPYNEALVHLALEKSRHQFGDYEIAYFEEKLSPARARVETELNRAFNVNIAGSWLGPYANRDKIFEHCKGQYQYLLGLRAFIIRKDDQQKFAQIKTLEDLNRFKLVQDRSWPDGNIIEASGLEVHRFVGMENLLRTLANKRVDYLPVSILEAHSLLARFHEYDNLTLANDVLLFYPHPGCIYVSAQTPNISRRIGMGLDLAQADGSMNALFSKHFSEVENFLKSRSHLTFVLRNPNLSVTENTDITQHFLQGFKPFIRALAIPTSK